jgi:hypothetical protein
MKLLSILIVALLLVGCGQAERTTAPESSPTASSTPAASPLTGFERDLQFVRNGQFKYVFVFSRKDGKPLDKEDAAFLRTNAPQVVDWVKNDDGTKVIGGTNFNLEEGGMALLQKRFVVENYSGK